MLDFDKINKYNRILSAKSGTQVPKFLTPASTLQLSSTGVDEGFANWLKAKGLKLHEDNFEELWGLYQNSIKDLSPQPLTGSSKGLMFLSNTNNISLPTTTLGGTSKQLIMPPSVTAPVKSLENIFSKDFNPESLINLNQLNGPIGPVTLLDIDAKAKGLPAPPATMDPDPKIAAADARYAEAIKNDPTMLAKMNLQISEGILKADKEVAHLLKMEQAGQTAGAISQAALQVGNGIAKQLHDGSNERAEGAQITNMTNSAIDAAGAEISKVNPMVGAIIQNGLMVGNIASEIGGTQTDKMTTVDSIMDSGLMQASGLGFLNGALGKKSDSFAADKTLLEQIGGSYGGSSSTILDALDKAGKKYGWFSNRARRKANEQIAEAKRQQDVMGVINLNTQDRLDMASSNHDLNHLSYRMTLSGGYDLRYNRAAKEGMKFDEWEPTIEGIWEPEIELFKKGGKTSERKIDVIETDTNQKSVIPEGALHKNKHHLKDTGLDDSELTKKGIPVVDNHGEQQAEIELNEIIFTLEVTKELEKLYKIYYSYESSKKEKDNVALEAGKLLWKEILYNTDDRTGLIDSLKQGGVLKAEEGTSMPSWTPTINPFGTFNWGSPSVLVAEVVQSVPQESSQLPTFSTGQLPQQTQQTQQLTQQTLETQQQSLDVNMPKDGPNTPKGGRTKDWFEPNPEVVRRVVAASNTTTIDAGHHGTVPMRPMDKGYGWCTAGPHTFYNRGIGVKLNGHWWVDANGKQITASSRVVDTGIGKVGFKKVWTGDEADTKTADFKAAIRPGDVVTSYGGGSVHAAMCCGIDAKGNPIMKADAPNSRVWVYRSGTGRRGKESVQVWRYAGDIKKAKEGGILSAKKGLKLNDDSDFQEFLQTLPSNLRNYSENSYRMKRYWELNGKPKNFEEALKKKMFTLEDDGFYHAKSVAYNPELDEYEFMKMPGHDTLWMEEDGWYNGMDWEPKPEATKEQIDSGKKEYFNLHLRDNLAEDKDWQDFRNNYVIDKSGPFWKYIHKNHVSEKKQGGIITQEDINLMVKQALLNLLK